MSHEAPLAELAARALAQARAAADAEEVPVGAVAWLGGRVLAEAHNRTLLDTDPTAHAEIVALREAARQVDNHRLGGLVLVTTLEPCLMCCGALLHARVATLAWAADDPKAGATALLGELQSTGRTNHRVELVRCEGAAESAELLRRFFRARR